jgi:hypothetical protein
MLKYVKRQLVNYYREIDIEIIMNVVYIKCLVLLEVVVFSIGNYTFPQFGLPLPSYDVDWLDCIIFIVNRD